jgi:hypothetical protein
MAMTIELRDGSNADAPLLHPPPAFDFAWVGYPGTPEFLPPSSPAPARWRIQVSNEGAAHAANTPGHVQQFRVLVVGFRMANVVYRDDVVVGADTPVHPVVLQRDVQAAAAIPRVSVAHLLAGRQLPSGDIVSLEVQRRATGYGGFGIWLRRGWPGRTGQHVTWFKQAQFFRGGTPGTILRSEHDRTPEQLGAREDLEVEFLRGQIRPALALPPHNAFLTGSRMVFSKAAFLGTRTPVFEVFFEQDLPWIGFPDSPRYVFTWEKD